MNKRRLSQASLLRLPICFFPQNDLDFQFAFSRAGKSKMVKTSNQAILIAQPSMNKRRLSQASLLRLPICFFQGREKAKWFRLPICFFPGLEKAKRLRLPICFFPAREKAKLFQISNLLFPNPGKSNRKSEEQLFLQRGQVTNMTCADLSQDLREPFATAVRAHSKSAFEIRSLTRKRWVFERRSYSVLRGLGLRWLGPLDRCQRLIQTKYVALR